MPTDALRTFRDVMLETEAYGFDKVMAEQQELGTKVRAALESRGVISVAAEGFQAPRLQPPSAASRRPAARVTAVTACRRCLASLRASAAFGTTTWAANSTGCYSSRRRS